MVVESWRLQANSEAVLDIMIRFKVGCNFDASLLSEIDELNNAYSETNIAELYGSDKDHAYLTARPAYRLPDIAPKDFETFVKRVLDRGLIFNYTMNSPYPGSKKVLKEREKLIQQLVKHLEGIGISLVTISNPLIAEIVRSASTSIGIEVSTIANVESVTQIKAWHDRYNISGICTSLHRNRSFRFIQNAAAYCRQNSIKLTLMANEFCSTGGARESYSTSCIFRESCYFCHAENETKKDDLLFRGYPMSQCMASRASGASWLKCFFIRPEDLEFYQSIGVSQFKITGRTGSTNYLRTILEAYMRKEFDGNLLSLWKPLQTIRNGRGELEFTHKLFIDNKQLGRFLDNWKKNRSHNCSDELCGVTCTYCDEFYKDML